MFIAKYLLGMQQIRHATTNQTLWVGIVDFTPEDAAYILENVNLKNRSLVTNNVEKIRSSMEKDSWVINGETIIFSKDGELLNGQHRLSACAQSGKIFSSLTVVGVSEEAFSTLDSGRKRRAQDILSIDGHRNACVLAATVRNFKEYGRYFISDIPEQHREFFKKSNSKFEDVEEMRKIADAFPELGEIISEQRIYSTKKVGNPSVRHALTYFLRKKDRPLSDKFWESVVVGTNVGGKDDPVIRLRECLMSRTGHHRNIREELILIIKAWNAYKLGAPIKRKLSVLEGENIPNIL